jgi:NADH-quinone oxidoreductase subunit G
MPPARSRKKSPRRSRGVKKVAVLSGPSLYSEEIIQAAANVAFALKHAGQSVQLGYTMPECNSLGLGLLDGKPLDEAFAAVREGRVDTVVVLESNLYRRADAASVDAFLAGARNIVSLIHTIGPTSSKAHYLIPVDTFAEGDGTIVNNEGRAQRFFQSFVPEGDVQESWRWLFELQQAAGRDGVGTEITLDLVLDALAAKEPDLAETEKLMPDAAFRIFGRKIPRQSHRFSGRTAIKANIKVSEEGVPQDPDSPYGFTMEGFGRKTPPQLVASFWSPGWNSPQAVTRFQEEVGGPLRGGDPGVRLIAPVEGQAMAYFHVSAAAFEPKTNTRLAVPLYHIFGSDELSALSPPVAERSPMMYVAVNADDGEALQSMRDGDTVELNLGGEVLRLPIRLRPGLPKGAIGLPAGLAGQPWRKLPVTGTIRRGPTP